MKSDIISYYKDRATEFEKVYNKPERQTDLLLVSQILQDTFTNKTVFEIACGTGYWTEKIAKTAKSVLATDINNAVMEVAKAKNLPPLKVNFQIADVFNLANTTPCESLFGGFIWSHIKLQDLHAFVDIANSIVESNGTIVFIDNNYVANSSLPVTEKDSFGNTYQTRTLENGTTHKVLKNFPTEKFVRQILENNARDIVFTNLQYYWILQYKTL